MAKKGFTKEGLRARVKRVMEVRKEMESKVRDLHVKVQKGNTKTGSNCWTVSLLPIVDCCNCGGCSNTCYDMRNDLRFPAVIEDRCRNSLIHQYDIARYWSEIDMQIKANSIMELRLNVGGDLYYEDFQYVADLGRNNPKTKILFFTKNYKGINKFLNENNFPENVHPIMSAWEGMKMGNPHELPCSHVLYEDGRTTYKGEWAYYCTGNCSECAFNEKGCWTLKKNEHVIFHIH